MCIGAAAARLLVLEQYVALQLRFECWDLRGTLRFFQANGWQSRLPCATGLGAAAFIGVESCSFCARIVPEVSRVVDAVLLRFATQSLQGCIKVPRCYGCTHDTVVFCRSRLRW